MRLFNTICILLVALGISAVMQAHQKAIAGPDDTLVVTLRAFDRRNNAPKEGMILPPFEAMMDNGKLLNNASLRGKISLLLFWYPECGCFNPDVLGALPELTKQHQDFQIISIVSDTGGLALFRSRHALANACANIHAEAKMHELNGNNGFPSCVLVGRDGNIARISGFLQKDIFDEQGFTDKIRELLMF